MEIIVTSKRIILAFVARKENPFERLNSHPWLENLN